MKNILITGGAGFIGYKLAKALNNLGISGNWTYKYISDIRSAVLAMEQDTLSPKFGVVLNNWVTGSWEKLVWRL